MLTKPYAGGTAAAPGPSEIQCPVFAALMDAVARREGQAILHLGRPHAAQLELLAPHRCKLFFEDGQELVQGLSGDAEEDQARLRQWLAQWTAAGDAGLDAVNAWDIFNYLEPPLLDVLTAHLRPLLRPGACLYFLVYSQRDMPAQPVQYKSVAADRLAFSGGGGTRPSPRLSQMELKRRLPDFAVVKSVLLRNGVQEYLLSFRP